MDFTEVVKNRRSIRKYKPDPVPEEILIKILDAARVAPTWANMQGVRYIVVSEPDNVKHLAEAIGQKWMKNIPVFIAVVIAPGDSGKNVNNLEYFMCDAAICMEHIILAATNEGLGTCWVGHFDEEKVKDVLNVNKRSHIIALTPIGYPDTVPSEQKRKNLDEIVYREKFGEKW